MTKRNDHTFAICAYKESPYLEECILSLKNQTVKSNIIMATSTPNEWIQGLAEKYEIPLYINTGEGGIAQDWNFAYRQAKTDYVTIAHQDDIYEPNYLKMIFGELKKGFHEAFHLEEKDLRTYSPLTLAYIGDGVYELVIRTVLVKKGNCPVNQLHRKASSLVKAASQSAMMEFIEPMLTEEEHSVYRRGRNAHSPTMAKHATMADYRRATGFEALMGYLYLKEDFCRIVELVRAGIREDQI